MTHRKTVHIPLEAARWPIQRKWAQLDDLCDGVYDCPHSTPIITDNGPLVVRSQDVRTGVFRADEAAHVSEDTYQDRIARAEPAYGDILYSREGTYFGIAAEVPPNTRVCLGQRMVLIRPKRETVNSRFLRLWLNSPVLSRHIHGFRDGTVAERLNMPTIRALPVPVFALKEQEAIASILGPFDDKIELNRKMNETVEEITSSIFRDWFVDFGPIHAKIKGRPAYLAPEMWGLFPDRLDDGGLPAGWEKRNFGSLLSDSIGGDWGLDEPDDENTQPVCIIRGTDLPAIAAGGVGKVPTRFTTERKAASRTLSDGDIVIEVSGGSPTQPTGRSILITRSILERFPHPVVCASFCRRFRPKAWQHSLIASEHLAFLYASGGTWEYQNQSTGIANFQTTLFLEKEEVVWPGDLIAAAFAKQVEPLIRFSNRNENESLAQLRDLLLPKLLSGEIRLREAEKLVKKVS